MWVFSNRVIGRCRCGKCSNVTAVQQDCAVISVAEKSRWGTHKLSRFGANGEVLLRYMEMRLLLRSLERGEEVVRGRGVARQ